MRKPFSSNSFYLLVLTKITNSVAKITIFPHGGKSKFFFAICTWPIHLLLQKFCRDSNLRVKNDVWISQVRLVQSSLLLQTLKFEMILYTFFVCVIWFALLNMVALTSIVFTFPFEIDQCLFNDDKSLTNKQYVVNDSFDQRQFVKKNTLYLE